MPWQGSAPELVERFRRALPDDAVVEPRQMFGYPCAFVNGHFFVGLHEQRVIARLPGDLVDVFPELRGARPFDPRGTGKGMKDWLVVPAEVSGDEARLRALFASMLEPVRALPPKEKKPRGPRKPRA